MSKRALCKFFAHGACLKGDHCEFSHDWKAPPNNICTYYQKGACAYGSRCRYDHVKVSRSQAPASSSSVDLPLARDIIPAFSTDEHSASDGPFHPPTESAWGENSGHTNVLGTDDNGGYLRSVGPADQSICSFAAAGDCPRGEKCPHIHGDLCPSCGKQCLHPFRPEEREEHVKTCLKRQSQLEALRHSQEIECCVCLERVLSKATTAERKFGILSECDHPFCISCIRNWRNNSPAGFDINSALRACPICRKLSYFVIPSVIWYASKEEKQEIVDSYKAKLRSIDCKHFDFGNGTCPFGTSCFYKHTVKPGSFPDLYSSRLPDLVELQSNFDYRGAVNESLNSHNLALEHLEDLDNLITEHAYRDGRLEEVVLRHLGAEDGSAVIAKDIRLSDFLSNLQIM